MLCRIGLGVAVLSAAASALAAAPSPSTEPFESLRSRPFGEFLAAYRAAEADSRSDVLASFVAAREAGPGFPVVAAAGEVVFVYVAPSGVDDVRLVGDFAPKSHYNTYWDPAGEPMTRPVPEGSLFFARRTFDPDARLDYAFVVDGERIPDPLNPRTLVSGVGGGEVSELVMPGHELSDDADPRPGVAKGTVTEVDEAWADPTVRVYLPPDYDPDGTYPALYTADGTAWLELLRLPTILDNVIAEGRIEPVVAVMVDPGEDRGKRYYYDPDLVAYLDRLVGFVDSSYATRSEPGARVHAGTSAGGRASLFVAFERPDLFRRVALLSPALYGPASYWKAFFGGEVELSPGLEVWMSAGTYEGVIPEDVRVMEEHLTARGVPVTTVTTNEGHSFGTWRHVLPSMLEHFFAPDG